jgi:hypothetical protein
MSYFSFKNTVETMKNSFGLEGNFPNPTNLSSPLGTVAATAAGALKAGGFHCDLTPPLVVDVGASMDATNVKAPHGVVKCPLQPADVSLFSGFASRESN